MCSIITALACQATRFLVLAAVFSSIACGGGNAEERDAAVSRAEQIANINEALKPLPDGAFKAKVSASALPSTMRAGQAELLKIKVLNASDGIWPARGRSADGYFQINLGNVWYDIDGNVLADANYVRSGLPTDVKPGEEVELSLTVSAPPVPGDYTLEIDLLQEMVCWFHEKGSESIKTKVRVE